MTIPVAVREAESLLRAYSDTLTRPRPRECLCCFVYRCIEEFGCDNTHRFAVRYRDANAPRATALLSGLAQMEACCCDCEMFANAYALAPSLGDLRDDDAPASVPECAGVRKGSVQPCANWR